MPLFTDYAVDGFFDEMFEAPDRPREAVHDRLTLLPARPMTEVA